MNGLLLTLLLLQGNASIDGIVVQAGSNDPLPQAQIVIAPVGGLLRDTRTTASDNGGRFRIAGLAPGNYRLFFEHEGFVRAEYGQRTPGKGGVPVEIAANRSVSGVSVTLTPTSTIHGRIVDASNDPVSNVTVKALKPAYRDGERILQAVQSAQTDDRGEYRLFGLIPGHYFLSATPEQSPSIGGGSINTPSGTGAFIGPLQNTLATGGPIDPRALDGGTDLTVYAPGTPDAAGATAIDLKPGVSFNAADLRTMRVRSFSIRGQVVDEAGQPVQFALATLTRANAVGEQPVANLNLTQGRALEFSGVLPGVYDLNVANNGATADKTARLTVTVGNENIENLRVVLRPVISIKGRIVSQDGAAGVPSVRVRLRGDRATASTQLTPSAPDGSFTISRIGTGDYRVDSIDPLPPNLYLVSARLGNSDALDSFVHIEGEVTDQLEIVLSSKTGSIDAVVVDLSQRPSPATTVVLVPDTARRQRFELYRTATTDASGRVSIAAIPPGSYKLFAWQDIETNAWQNADALRPYENRGTAVTIGENVKTSATVTVIE